MNRLVIQKKDEGQRINKYLMRLFPKATSSLIYKLLRKKRIKLNGSKAEGSEIIKDGDVLSFYISPETMEDMGLVSEDNKSSKTSEDTKILSADKNHFDREYFEKLIIYEDEDVLILNKPVGVLSQKAHPDDYSINEQIVDYYRLKEDSDNTFTPSVCNRLDRNTSGIILAGMSYKGSRILSKMLKDRDLSKYYLTVVKGDIKEEKTIKGFLTKNESHNQVKVFKTKEEALAYSDDKPAYIETQYIPLKHGSINDGKRDYELTLLKVKLITGKTHQIRAHLHSIGCPIIGDGKYGFKDINAAAKKNFALKHQLLHAYEIKFPEDIKDDLEGLAGKSFNAKLTKEFENVMKVLQED